ncbi:hypothetical protein GCM10010988_40330 [Cnuibacter physcomitrellae]|uniref:Uncharacterized protein n=1 Tax=Cnuibacter physcomitrellae TaxID=1619308 RepID=A0A1X9LTK0_9MICO|nr:type IV secretory system conjugative DNA transfer family protein [Cnuibacter physcomitrellae]ARJ07648.1 hypothetical protein B5808_19925 [Cnuibacter physcomitrellae]GGI42696.1 hypothetical protein GCM10010988_40330 [Cnuibacter physcomitrellae]
MSEPNRRSQPGSGRDQLILFALGIGGVLVLVGVYLAFRVGSEWDGVNADTRENPVKAFFGIGSGSVLWPGSATLLLIGAAVLLIAAAVLISIPVRRASKKRTRVDRFSRYMGQGSALAAYTDARALRAKAEKFGGTWTGVSVGRTVVGNREFVSGLEEVYMEIAGPRTGKSTSRCIPAIVNAVGAVLSTSNKRDLVDSTRDIRAQRGPVWVFDPQQIAMEPVTWWWNPLAYIVPEPMDPRYKTALMTADVRAAKLASHFANGSKADGAKGDAFFEPKGENLVKSFLLAAALDQRSIIDAYMWTTEISVTEVVDILTGHGFITDAASVRGNDNAAPDQRSGVFETAAKMLACLQYAQIRPWITGAGPYDSRPRFDAHEFVRSTGTLYSLSREGAGTASTLVTALTAEVAEAAEAYATEQGGRLRVPMVCVLDEAANVCLWRELPQLYSHYGSRGILLMTILQAWSQGVRVWGKEGMDQLWSAANVKVYGGGVDEEDFLGRLSRLIGNYDKETSTVTHSRQGRSTSFQLQRQAIMEIGDLRALPRGRAVVLASGAPATMVRTIPWMETEHADAIAASVRAHDPGAQKTLTDLEKEAAKVRDEQQKWERTWA